MLNPDPAVLLGRIAASLELDVAPHLEPSYQRTEVEAAVALLRHVAVRVGWREDQIAADLAADAAALTLITDAPAPVESGAATHAELMESRQRLGAAIDSIYTSDRRSESDLKNMIVGLTRLLRDMVETELERNRRL